MTEILAPAATWWRRLVADRAGAVALIFALTLIPISIGAGMAIDLGRAYIVKSRLGYALDAAGLAVGSSQGTDDELNAIMERYFDANYPAEELGVPATPVMTINESEIHLSATADLNTFLMSIIGVDEIQVAAEATIIRETKGLEVVLVLDNTGSMSGSKINSLRSAASVLVDILFGTEERPEKLAVGVVPFASTVNIGEANSNLLTALDPSDFSPDRWRGCVEARPAPHDSRDSSTLVGGRWPPYLYPSNSSNRWPPIRGSRGQRRGPNKNCPVPLLPLTNVKRDILSTISSMEARGTTHVNLGAVWGWRVLSPEAPFTEGLPYDDEENEKAAIIMTDGENFISSSSRGYSAYGSLSEGRLGTTSKFAAERELDRRLLDVCAQMKDVGITVYTITFQVDSQTARNVMADCATDESKYFDSPSTSDLERVFRAIGAELSNLRIGR